MRVGGIERFGQRKPTREIFNKRKVTFITLLHYFITLLPSRAFDALAERTKRLFKEVTMMEKVMK